MRFSLPWVALLVAAMAAGCTTSSEPPETRPANWAQPVAPSAPDNFYQVSPELFRSAVPKAEHIAALRKAGIKTIVNLRESTGDTEAFRAAGFVTLQHPMEAGNVSQADLVAVLKLLRKAPRPVLVHCWHGADRTGFIVAGYRIVREGWTKEEAVRELRRGGFGFHEIVFGNIPEAVNALDVATVRREAEAP
jgi:protein tyrosine/serine phosphatase